MAWFKKLINWIKSLFIGEYVKPRLWEWVTAGVIAVSGLVDTVPWFYVTIIAINTYIIFRLFRMIREERAANPVVQEQTGSGEKLKDLYLDMQDLKAYLQETADGNSKAFSTQDKMRYSKIEATLMDKLDELDIDNPRQAMGGGYVFHNKHSMLMLVYLDQLAPLAYKMNIEEARKIQFNAIEED